MKHSIILTAILLLLVPFCSRSQDKISINTNKVGASNYKKYFDSVQNENKKSIVKLKRSNYGFVVVTITASSKMQSVEILEIPGVPFGSIGGKLYKSTF